MATGSDGAGSIRLRPVACNLVGLKVTRGLLPQRTGPWDWSSVDGFLTRTVADTAAMIDQVHAPDLEAWMPQPPDSRPSLAAQLDEPTVPLRIGVLSAPPNGATVEDAQGAALDEIASSLAGADHQGFVDWVNVIGLPAVGLPTHTDARGVPFGIQRIGSAFSEALLLRMGAQLEARHQWNARPLPAALC